VARYVLHRQVQQAVVLLAKVEQAGDALAAHTHQGARLAPEAPLRLA
jgi:hypothetical protein